MLPMPYSYPHPVSPDGSLIIQRLNFKQLFNPEKMTPPPARSVALLVANDE
jgi:hypothetical protein